jgi:hypothetical protein
MWHVRTSTSRDRRISLRREEAEQQHLLAEQDLRHPLFLAAQAYLRTIGRPDLSWLSSDRSTPYQPLP